MLLAVPNWSFGRDRDLLRAMGEELSRHGVRTHYLRSDVDHNRTVSAFSGPVESVFEATIGLAELALDRIDLNRHSGEHPRIGALDVCPFVLLPGIGLPQALERVEAFAETLAQRFGLPVFLYEKSERGRHEAELPALRRGGFGTLMGRELQPDFGPARAHPLWGASVVGVRDFLIAMNVNLRSEDQAISREIARKIRRFREEGDSRFLGVRALGLRLASRQLTQVSLNLTLPDVTPPDPVIEYVLREAAIAHASVAETELIGVLRASDLPHSTRLPHESAQVVPEL